jgi:hypothetical protein
MIHKSTSKVGKPTLTNGSKNKTILNQTTVKQNILGKTNVLLFPPRTNKSFTIL